MNILKFYESLNELLSCYLILLLKERWRRISLIMERVVHFGETRSTFGAR